MAQSYSIKQDSTTAYFTSKLEGFDKYFKKSIQAAMQNMATSGVTAQRKAIRGATTSWGAARMAGSHYGVKFQSYGRSAGREDTGFMYDSVESFGSLKRKGEGYHKASWGWSEATLREAPYIADQEFGFMSTGVFDAKATAKNGTAKFKEGNSKWVKGAFSTYASRDSVARRIPSALSNAWNEAQRDFKAAGNKANAGSWLENRGEYILARALSGRKLN